jgi:hypothetical protein
MCSRFRTSISYQIYIHQALLRNKQEAKASITTMVCRDHCYWYFEYLINACEMYGTLDLSIVTS